MRRRAERIDRDRVAERWVHPANGALRSGGSCPVLRYVACERGAHPFGVRQLFAMPNHDHPMDREARALENVPSAPRPGDGRTGNDDERIRYAIANKRLLKFKLYDLWRIAEPHDYGIRNGAPQLLVYQVRGESQSGKLPAWRWVMLGHACAFEVLEETFAGSRNADVRAHMSWDKVFSRVE